MKSQAKVIDREVQLVTDAVEGRQGRLCRGSGLLATPDAGLALCTALQEKRGGGHLIHAFCVMPNHVHLLLTPNGQTQLGTVLGEIKGRSAFLVNRACSRTGRLWEKESFDHAVRGVEHFQRFRSYIENNPVKAGLCHKPEAWQYSSAHSDWDIDQLDSLVEPRQTPFTELRGRGDLPHLYKSGCTYFVTFRMLDAVRLHRRQNWSEERNYGDDAPSPNEEA